MSKPSLCQCQISAKPHTSSLHCDGCLHGMQRFCWLGVFVHSDGVAQFTQCANQWTPLGSKRLFSSYEDEDAKSQG
jgi:hypothetical protein